MTEFLLLIIGLSVLLFGGDLLVRGAVAVAEKLGIPPLIIGLTIVSLGTSAPELFISVQAALDGAGGLAIGNVVGSNIANVLLVLGVPAIIKQTSAHEDGVGRNIVVMVGVTIVFMIMLSKGSLGFYDGLILIVILSWFLWDQFATAKKSRNSDLADYQDEVHDVPKDMRIAASLLLAGIILLPFGAWLSVENATEIARTLGVSDEVIGLTIVAVGTSLPELAASVMAVVRGNSTIAVGNVVGSNLFNIAAIMGVTTLIAPLTVGGNIITLDMWIMLATALLMVFLAFYAKTINKMGGLMMTCAYVAYLALAFM